MDFSNIKNFSDVVLVAGQSAIFICFMVWGVGFGFKYLFKTFFDIAK